jgi:hypothetical protein
VDVRSLGEWHHSGCTVVVAKLSERGSEGIVVVLATRYGEETKPVCLEVAEGETGIPIFDTISRRSVRRGLPGAAKAGLGCTGAARSRNGAAP